LSTKLFGKNNYIFKIIYNFDIFIRPSSDIERCITVVDLPEYNSRLKELFYSRKSNIAGNQRIAKLSSV